MNDSTTEGSREHSEEIETSDKDSGIPGLLHSCVIVSSAPKMMKPKYIQSATKKTGVSRVFPASRQLRLYKCRKCLKKRGANGIYLKNNTLGASIQCIPGAKTLSDYQIKRDDVAGEKETGLPSKEGNSVDAQNDAFKAANCGNNEKKNRFDEVEKDPADGHKQHEWESRYTRRAWFQMIAEAIYTAGIAIISVVFIFLIWDKFLSNLLGIHSKPDIRTFQIYAYYFTSGMLGGSVFALKFFYHVVAKGFWSVDRVFWRILTPLISALLSFAIGVLANGHFLQHPNANQTATIISTGFLVGYFGDMAVAKLAEIAKVLFGPTQSK
jgi:hypothetical protein